MNDEDDREREPPRLREWEGWAACLIGAGMPTVVLTSIVPAIEGKTAPAFAPALYIGVFTVGVLLVRPWTFR